MDQWPEIFKSIQLVRWCVEAGLSPTTLGLAMAGAWLVFFALIPGWIRLWKLDWNPMRAVFINFSLASATALSLVLGIGYSRLDGHLEELMEQAREKACAPFAPWHREGFPEGLNRIDPGVDMCAILYRQTPMIAVEIRRHEPFNSWPGLEKIPARNHYAGQECRYEAGIRMGDYRFTENFNGIFQEMKLSFQTDQRIIACHIPRFLALAWGGIFTIGLIYLANMAYRDGLPRYRKT